jgi:conserved oligomeric golgi complex subunit 5
MPFFLSCCRIQKVAFRTIELFLRHATLIRPSTQAVKMRLAIDFAQLEEALSAFSHIFGDLGKQYRLLRSFKPLLFQEAQVIADSPLIGNLIPYSLAIQFLISAYGPPEIKSAHENRGWSVSRYTTWMDEHTSEKERMILFK